MSESDAIQNMFTAGSLTAFLIMLLIMYLRRDELSWKNGSGKGWWGGYLGMMATRFHNTPPKKQQEYILAMSQIVTIGSLALVLSFIYPLLSPLARVLAVPPTLVSAWFIAGFIASYLGRRWK